MTTSQHQPTEQPAASSGPAPRNGSDRAPRAYSHLGRDPRVTGWVRWIWFAGAMAIVGGTANLINGLIAVLDDSYYSVTGTGELLVWDFTAWGWIHIVIGVLLVVLGAMMIARPNPAVRTAGVLVAGLNAIAQFAYLGVYPVLAIVTIALDVLVIWALLVHGGEAEEVVA